MAEGRSLFLPSAWGPSTALSPLVGACKCLPDTDKWRSCEKTPSRTPSRWVWHRFEREE